MIRFDLTNASAWNHRSGLARVSVRLREELGSAAEPWTWAEGSAPLQAEDWLFTTELFSERERPGIRAFLERPPCRIAALFHDAIPLKLPHVTWPASVARHPEYMKLLSRFDRVWAVSAASREDLLGFWAWQGVARPPPVEVLPLGADANRGVGRGSGARAQSAMCSLVTVGILEPRKNQELLLDAAEALWRDGLPFELHVAGRTNPYFGKPIAARLHAMKARWPGLQYHPDADDRAVAQLLAGARAAVFPTIAEGCGLPLLESLWAGVPCVCSDLPVLLENASGGGCLAVPVGDQRAWETALGLILTDDSLHGRLVREAASRSLPTWSQAARILEEALR